MIVDLKRLGEVRDARGEVTAVESVTITDAFDEARTVACSTTLSWEKRGGAFFFHGESSGELTTRCHRCLEDTTAPLWAEFDVVVRRGVRRASEPDGGEDDAGDLVTVPPSEHEFSFDRYIIENLMVSVPMRILCREDCKGLCPRCGINRNVASCDCGENPDPRWDALRNLNKE